MLNSRLHSQIACIALMALPHIAPAEELARFVETDPSMPSVRRLRTEPQMLSRFPTTFSCAISETSKTLVTVDINGRVWKWPSTDDEKATLVAETKSEPSCAVLSNDGRMLAFAEPDGSVVLFDLETNQTRFNDRTLDERTVSLQFTPDAKRFAGVTSEGHIRILDVGSGRLLHELAAERNAVQTIAFSPDGKQLAIASRSREVTVHDVSGQKSPTVTSNSTVIIHASSRVTALAFTSNGEQLVIASADGTARVHDLEDAQEPTLLGSHPFAIWSMAFDRESSRMATGSWDGTVKVWDTISWTEVQSLKTHEESVVAMTFDSEGGLVSAGLDGRLLKWSPEVASIAPSATITGRSSSVWVAVYAPNGDRLFVGGRDKRFELWDVTAKTLLVSQDGHPITRCASFSPDGKILATGGDNGEVFLHDVATGDTRVRLLRHPGAVSAVVFADEGHTLVSACDGGVVKVWDTATGKAKATWSEHKQQIYCANISPDGKWLVTGGGNWTTGDPGELIIWELKTGRVHAKLAGHKLAIWNVVFTPNGERFATSDSSGAVKVWNLETLKEERTLQHSTWVRPLAMSPDGNTLAVGRGDGSIRLWNTKTWTQSTSCSGHESFSFSLQFSVDGKTLASGGNDGAVQLWQLKQ